MSSLPKVFASKLGIPFSNLAKPSSSRFETLIQFSTSELYSNHHCWFLEASERHIRIAISHDPLAAPARLAVLAVLHLIISQNRMNS